MEDWTTNPMNAVTAGLAILVFIMFIWMGIIGRRLKKLRKQYTEFMGNTGVTNMEDVIIQLKESLSLQEQQSNQFSQQLQEMRDKLPQQKGRVGIVRYNAFSEQGSDLSFSIAIVNDERDGLVISSIHSRETSYVYAKPVAKGQSAYPLTPEELKAIDEAK